jgi:hypothetical protein
MLFQHERRPEEGEVHMSQDREKNGKPDKDIEIMVATTADDLDETFKRKQPLSKVFEKTLKLVGGQDQPDQFALEYNHEPLDLDREIGDLADELGWGDRVELELVPKPVVV